MLDPKAVAVLTDGERQTLLLVVQEFRAILSHLALTVDVGKKIPPSSLSIKELKELADRSATALFSPDLLERYGVDYAPEDWK
jgi:hypothetical protein